MYRKRTADTWHRPAVVLGTEGSIVVLKHAGNVLRVHESRVSGLSPSQENQEASDISPICTQEEEQTSADGARIRSTKVCFIPIFGEGSGCFLEVEVIPGNLPLLISLESLEKMHAVLIFIVLKFRLWTAGKV